MLFKNKKIVKKKSFRKKSHKRKENMRKSHKRKENMRKSHKRKKSKRKFSIKDGTKINKYNMLEIWDKNRESLYKIILNNNNEILGHISIVGDELFIVKEGHQLIKYKDVNSVQLVGKEEIEKNERKRKIIEEKEVRMKEEEERRKRIDEAQKEEERRMKEEEKRMKEEEKRMKEDINFYKFIFTEPHEILYIDKNKIENESIFQPYLKTAVDRVIKVDHKYQLDLKLYLLFLNSDKNIEELIKEKNINLFHLLNVIKLYNIFDNDSMNKIISKIADRKNASIIANQFEDYYLKTVDLSFRFNKKKDIYEYMKNNFDIFISIDDVISLNESQKNYLFELIYSKLVFNEIISNNSIGFGVAVGKDNIVKLINVIEYMKKEFLLEFENRFFSLSITTNSNKKYVSGNYASKKTARGELTGIETFYNLNWIYFSISDILELKILFE